MATKKKRSRQSDAPELSRERVAQVAVELLDERGLKGLTMRRLAEHLGSGVMSIYWHVDNKNEVFDLALDYILEHRRPSTMVFQDWRAEAVYLLEEWRGIMLQHPWSSTLLTRRALGPNTLQRLDTLGALLSGAGVSDDDLNTAIWALWNYVLGATVTRASFELSDEDRQPVEPVLGQYPTIERSGLLQDDDWEGVFRRGLDFLLIGIVPITEDED